MSSVFSFNNSGCQTVVCRPQVVLRALLGGPRLHYRFGIKCHWVKTIKNSWHCDITYKSGGHENLQVAEEMGEPLFYNIFDNYKCLVNREDHRQLI